MLPKSRIVSRGFSLGSIAVLPVVLSFLGCSSGTSGASGSRVEVSCRQKTGADTDSDCTDRAGTPRKLDCSDSASRDDAKARGCVPEKPDKPDDNDVCCPLSVFGMATLSGAGGSSGASGVETGGATSPGGGGGMSTATGGRTGSGGAQDHVVTCKEQRSKSPIATAVGAIQCGCDADLNPGTATYAGDQCGQGDLDLFCCADTTFPASGACSCQITRPWGCLQIETGPAGNVNKCSCAFHVKAVDLPTVTTCNLTTPYVQHCCRSAELPLRCECNSVACSSGSTEVTDCSTPAKAGLLPAPTECPAGKAKASTCSKGLEPKPAPVNPNCDSKSCTGTDCVSSGGYSFCCTYYCGSSSCEQHCTE